MINPLKSAVINIPHKSSMIGIPFKSAVSNIPHKSSVKNIPLKSAVIDKLPLVSLQIFLKLTKNEVLLLWILASSIFTFCKV